MTERTSSHDASHNDDGLVSRRRMLLASTIFAAASAIGSAAPTQTDHAEQQAPAASGRRKPNILVIFGDDIGPWDVSAYNRGIMGYRTPNIDRIVKEGAIFTDHYAQQSCTAGRAAFITGQSNKPAAFPVDRVGDDSGWR